MVQNRFSRTELFIGRDGVSALKNSHVAVFGVGGVGGYAVEALVRAGVGHLTLIDFDHFSVTNINRQLHALDPTIGMLKVEVVGTRCQSINPQMQLTLHAERYRSENAELLLNEKYDYVLDCIDTISAKIDLIQQCKERQLRVISSMGAANKIDPTQVKVADLFDSQKCRLARIMRKELRRRGVDSGVQVVYSTEEFHPLTQEGEAVARVSGEAWQSVPLGSISTLPSLFGLFMAGVVVKKIVGGDSSGC